MPRTLLLMAAAAAAVSAPLAAQLGPVGLPAPLPRVPDIIAPAGARLDSLQGEVRVSAARLLAMRDGVIARLLRDNPDTIERDLAGDPARRGELLVLDLDPAGLERARQAGFVLIEAERVDDLDLVVTRLAVPQGLSLARAQARLEALLPDLSVSSDVLHFTAGTAAARPAVAGAAAPVGAAFSVPVGVIDGGATRGPAISANKGFAAGAPRPSNHGSAVASLLAGAGARDIRVADVYGTDPAGGSALAIARALGWLVGDGSRVVTISLVGPSNPVLQRAIAAAHRKGVVIVAAVGNDGPAAPLAHPASYPGVVAVTGVDRRERPLIEAGRASHLDYAAPGADMVALDASGKRRKVRGTSYAAPLVAARIAAALSRGVNWRPLTDAEARDLGKRGPDPVYGRGLLCGACRRSL